MRRPRRRASPLTHLVWLLQLLKDYGVLTLSLRCCGATPGWGFCRRGDGAVGLAHGRENHDERRRRSPCS